MDDRGSAMVGRRDLLRTLGRLGTAAAGLPAARPAGVARAAAPGTGVGPLETAGLRIGYLPITDATPLLLAHAQGLYAAEGLDAAKPTLFRGWAQLAEAFQARQVDIVHILMPTAVWLRFGQGFPIKLVAWNHTDGSAFTVANGVKSL